MVINTALELLKAVSDLCELVAPVVCNAQNEPQDFKLRSRYSASTFSLALADQREEGPSPSPTLSL